MQENTNKEKSLALVRYLTPSNLIRYLGVSKNFFYVHIRNNADFPKPMTLIGSKKVYDRYQVDEWLSNNQVNA